MIIRQNILPMAITCLAFLISPAILNAQEPASPEGTAEAPVDTEQSLLDLYLQGGAIMHVIALCSLGAIAVASFCALRINKRRLMPPQVVLDLAESMSRRDVQGAYQICQAQPSVFTKTLGAAVLKTDWEEPKYNRAAMEKAAAETLVHEETRLGLWINYLNVFATVAPMLGLLGTVTGMIQAFNELAAGRSEPSDLAGGIGQAMITTAGGLIVGIPAMFLFFFFRNILTGTIADIEAAILAMLDRFTAKPDEVAEEASVVQAADGGIPAQ